MIEEKRRRVRELLLGIGIDNIKDIDEKIKKLNEKIKSLENTIKELTIEKEKYDRIINELEDKRDKLIDEKGKIDTDISLLKGTLKNIKKNLEKKKKELRNMEKAVNQGVCPLCKQKIPREHGIKILEDARKEIIDLENEMNKYQRKIEELERKSREYNENIVRIKKEIDEYKIKKKELERKYDKLYRELQELISSAKDLENTRQNIQQLINEINLLNKEIKDYNLIIEEYKRKVEEIGKLEEKRELINNRIKELRKEISDRDKKISGNEATINELKKRLEEYDRIRKEYENVRKERELYEKMANLLYGRRGEGAIYKLIDLIENRVRDRAYAKFRELFITYFSKLMEGHEIVSVDVDREFKPVIKINIGTSSSEITQPSGGQLTSVSLAYRLALNTIARSMIPQLRDSTLILDEPTYGFSPERVEKLRELLAEISKSGAKQVIVVTHDSSLMNIGDCRIKLSLRPGNNETVVEYEECILDEDTRKYINDILYRRSFIETPITKKTSMGGFTPAIKPSSNNNKENKKSEDKYSRKTKKHRNILDYIS
jgi:exonuclease SbcC